MLLPAAVFPADQAERESDSFAPYTGGPYLRTASGKGEQCGADGVVVVVDIVAIVVHGAVVVDICSVVSIVAGRPQPPPAEKAHSIGSPISIQTVQTDTN